MAKDAELSVSMADNEVRVEYGTPDWFGPGRFTRAGVALNLTAEGDVVASMRAEPDWNAFVFRLEATRDLDGLATDSFARPSYAWPAFDPSARRDGGVPDGTRAFGFQYMEFALPTHSDASLARWRLFGARPPVVEPLGLVAPDGRCLLLAPLDSFHEQIIAVPTPDGGVLSCGWHGDLDCVPARFATEIAVVAGSGARDCLDRYGALVQQRHGTRRPTPDADELGRRVSYWTDNGSAYWYRTEPGLDTQSTLRETLTDLRAREIPIGAVQLDSWWYSHEVVRPFNTEDWVVPPTGLTRWEPREDVLPGGLPELRAALGAPPLVTHCRHLSSSSPYVDEHDCWIDGDRAHPQTNDLYERWLDQAKSWGVETFEHDWLVESFLGVRGLRAEPGRARQWQEQVDSAAAEREMTLQWCMATPADFLQSVTLKSLTSIRTSGDHGYLLGPGELWAWFLLTNAFARALALRPYKDVFLSDRSGADNHSDVEALLAALSTGPVGIGDHLGRADRDVVMRTCRADGAIVRPDVPLAAVARCFEHHPVGRSVPLVAEAWTHHAAGRWAYAATLNVSRDQQRLEEDVEFSVLGAAAPSGRVACFDWRNGTAACVDANGGWSIGLEPLDWDLRVLAPILECGLAVIGDATRYATAGRVRLGRVDASDETVRCTVLGRDEIVRITGWAEQPPHAARMSTSADSWTELELTADEPTWWVDVPVPSRGSATLEIVA